ncbi:metal-sensing transcriptional repressor [Sphingobium cupriresistens]
MAIGAVCQDGDHVAFVPIDLRPYPPWGISDALELSSPGGYVKPCSALQEVLRMTEHRHESHPAIVKRLNRAGGHLRSTVDMIVAGRPCVEIVQQLHAVEKAVASAKRALINDHIDHCLVHADGTEAVGSAVEEFRIISKYL